MRSPTFSWVDRWWPIGTSARMFAGWPINAHGHVGSVAPGFRQEAHDPRDAEALMPRHSYAMKSPAPASVGPPKAPRPMARKTTPRTMARTMARARTR